MPLERKLISGQAQRWHRKQTRNSPDVEVQEDGGDQVVEEVEEEENDDVVLEEMLSEEERNAINAKLELMKARGECGVSLYQHLSELVTQILTGPVDGAVDTLEWLSGQLKVTRHHSALEPRPATQFHLKDSLLAAQWTLWKTIGRDLTEGSPRFDSWKQAECTADDNVPGPSADRLNALPDMLRHCEMFKMAGCGLPTTEYIRLTLAMRTLLMNWPIKSLRFWGKILGTRDNYYIVEAQAEDGELTSDAGQDEDRDSTPSTESDIEAQALSPADDCEEELPLVYKPPPVIPSEAPGTGTNCNLYFVCSQPGLAWHQLPHVTPDQIVAARQVRALFTGDLNHVPATFPPFPGNEANYLRAQIARITSATCISPIGYYKFEEDEEEEEEHTESRNVCVKDEDFEGVSSRDLSDPSLQSWVHHVNYILPQGRTVWYNPVANKEDRGEEEDEDEEEEEERNDPDEPEPELPQPLLVPIAEDVEVGSSPPWIVRLCSQFVPEHSPVSAASTRWPGAVAVATDRGKLFENLYVGWGIKNLADTFNPALPSEPMMEFPTGPEVIETEDPTPEEEAAVRAAMKEGELDGRRYDDEEEEEEEEEEDEGEGEEEFQD